MVGAHSAGDVGTPGQSILVLVHNGGKEFVVVRFDCAVYGAGSQIERTHRMAVKSLCLTNRYFILEVPASKLDVCERAVASSFNEEPCLVEVLLNAGGSMQFDECHLDLRVSVHGLYTVGSEHRTEVIGHSDRKSCKRIIWRVSSAKARYTRLNQVTVAVEFVTPFHV